MTAQLENGVAPERTIDNIESSRNTAAQLDWYQRRLQFFGESGLSPDRFVDTFPVFSPPSKGDALLETLRYWELIQDIPGDIFECGVAGGEFLMAMAHFSAIYEPHHYTRKIVGFDTFDGFTEPSKEDLSSKAKHMRAGGLSYDSYSYLEHAISYYDENRMIGNIPKVFLEKGDISKTLPAYLDRNPATIIGLLHMDLDLYKPTLDVLQAVRSRMAKGSVIIFDEINHQDYPGETLAVMEAIGIENIALRRVREASMAAYVRL